MSALTPEEEAELKAMEEEHRKPAPPQEPGAKIRPERFADFAPGLGDDGELFEVPPKTKQA